MYWDSPRRLCQHLLPILKGENGIDESVVILNDQVNIHGQVAQTMHSVFSAW